MHPRAGPSPFQLFPGNRDVCRVLIKEILLGTHTEDSCELLPVQLANIKIKSLLVLGAQQREQFLNICIGKLEEIV